MRSELLRRLYDAQRREERLPRVRKRCQEPFSSTMLNASANPRPQTAQKGSWGRKRGHSTFVPDIGQFAGKLASCPAPRASVGGTAYHMPNQGNGRTRVYRRKGDYSAFAELVSEANERLLPPARKETGKVECPLLRVPLALTPPLPRLNSLFTEPAAWLLLAVEAATCWAWQRRFFTRAGIDFRFAPTYRATDAAESASDKQARKMPSSPRHAGFLRTTRHLPSYLPSDRHGILPRRGRPESVV